VGYKYLAALFAGVGCIVVYRHIRSGRAELHTSGQTFTAERSKSPWSFWVMIAMEIALTAIMLIGAVILP
jgi:hypothetical protein